MMAPITQGIERDTAEQLQALDSRFLLAIHHGDVDVVQLARQELASRGLDGSGRWIGFSEAGQAFGV